MSNPHIRGITLGALAAENYDSLERYFFETKMFRPHLGIRPVNSPQTPKA